jgi:hypothetical protein
MKKSMSMFGAILLLIGLMSFGVFEKPHAGAVYKCTNCCMVKYGETNSTPWESGCRKSSSGMHAYVFAAHSGKSGFYCSKCKTEVYLKQSEGVSASASKCCSDGGLCSWYVK